MRTVPLDDEQVPPAPLDPAIANAVEVAETTSEPKHLAAASEARDWDEQGFDVNVYDERPPHWQE